MAINVIWEVKNQRREMKKLLNKALKVMVRETEAEAEVPTLHV